MNATCNNCYKSIKGNEILSEYITSKHIMCNSCFKSIPTKRYLYDERINFKGKKCGDNILVTKPKSVQERWPILYILYCKEYKEKFPYYKHMFRFNSFIFPIK